MKIARCLLPLFILVSATAWAGEAEFPGLKAIMSEADWSRARLDRLDPADVRLINEAFARYLEEGVAKAGEPAAVATARAEPTPPEKKRSLWARFGLVGEKKKETEYPVMHAKVTAWHGANGVVLDNGQVWDGVDPIRDELVGREIGIKAGKLGSFLLIVDGVDTNVRLHRVR